MVSGRPSCGRCKACHLFAEGSPIIAIMSMLPYPPPPQLGWYHDDATVTPQQVTVGLRTSASAESAENIPNATSTLGAAGTVSATAEPQQASQDDDNDDIDWEGTVLSADFTAKIQRQQYVLYNEQTSQRVIVDSGVLLGRKPSHDLPEGIKAVTLEDPTRTISRNHAAINIDKDGLLWIEDYSSLNGTYIIRDNTETKVEHARMRLEAPCTIRIGDQFFSFEAC